MSIWQADGADTLDSACGTKLTKPSFWSRSAVEVRTDLDHSL